MGSISTESVRAYIHNFWSKACFSQYPDEVKAKYSRFVFGLGSDDETQILVGDPALSKKEVLKPNRTFAGIADDLRMRFVIRESHAKYDYHVFVKKQGSNVVGNNFFGQQESAADSAAWPEFDSKRFEAQNSPSDVHGITKIFWISYNSIKVYLRRDLLARLPGRILRWDGTFTLVHRLMGDILGEEKCDTLGILAGEYGHILFWAFMKGEKNVNWQRMQYFVRMRCERVGAGEVAKVIAGYSDTCCQGVTDPTSHWFAKMWPSAKRAPYKDLMHGVSGVMSNTAGPSHQLFMPFNRALTGSLLEYNEGDIERCVSALLTKDRTLLPELAREQVLIKHKNRCRNKTNEVALALPKVWAAWNDVFRADAKGVADGERSFLRRPTRKCP